MVDTALSFLHRDSEETVETTRRGARLPSRDDYSSDIGFIPVSTRAFRIGSGPINKYCRLPWMDLCPMATVVIVAR